jgi:Ca2+-binding EF-hand superfamily protein
MLKDALSAGAVLLALCIPVGSPSAQSNADTDPLVTSAQVWDLDHNGTYTCDEWRQFATRIFNMADRNHDGYVDASEFKTIQQAVPIFKEADIAYFDDNRDGRLSRDEFVKKPNPIFARYDKNGDCMVTPQELNQTSASPQTPSLGRRGAGIH